MQTTISHEKYTITICSQEPGTLISKELKEAKHLRYDTIGNSSESTKIYNPKDKFKIENNFSNFDIITRNFLLPKLKVFELPSQFEEVEESIISDQNNDDDPYYHESLLSNAFDSKQQYF